jgi:hypothetical protein
MDKFPGNYQFFVEMPGITRKKKDFKNYTARIAAFRQGIFLIQEPFYSEITPSAISQ